MLNTFVALQTRGILARNRAQQASCRDRGSVTLEQVIFALGLFTLALAVVGGITAAVMSRLGQIN